MKISCLPVSLFGDIIGGKITIREWLRIGREMGLDAVDLSILLIENRTPRYLEGLKDQIMEEDIGIAMITCYPDFTYPDLWQRERELDYCFADIAAASELGAKYVRVTAGQNYPVLNVEEALDYVEKYLMRCRKRADDYGVKLLIENHSKPGTWAHEDFLYDTKVFLKLADRLKGSGIGINFDTANTWAFGDDAVGTFRKVLYMVDTIHVSDMTAPLEFCEIGTGNAPVREILSAAKGAGWDGWLCIEEASNAGLEGVKRAVDYVRTVWADV